MNAFKLQEEIYEFLATRTIAHVNVRSLKAKW